MTSSQIAAVGAVGKLSAKLSALSGDSVSALSALSASCRPAVGQLSASCRRCRARAQGTSHTCELNRIRVAPSHKKHEKR